MKVRVQIENDKIFVSCNGGSWYGEELNNNYLWLLGAIKELIDSGAETNVIAISDNRTNREDHQESLTTGNRNEV